MTEEKKEMMTCLKRVNEVGPWEHKENLDSWEKRGNDKTCSFCGSWHPDEFLAYCKKVIKTKAVGYSIAINDKRDKLYFQRPKIKNASKGSIKFYLIHIPKNRLKEFESMIKKAIEISWEVFMKTVNQGRKYGNEKKETKAE